MGDGSDDHCLVCERGGELMCCDGVTGGAACTRCAHPRCMSYWRAPTAEWYCPTCAPHYAAPQDATHVRKFTLVTGVRGSRAELVAAAAARLDGDDDAVLVCSDWYRYDSAGAKRSADEYCAVVRDVFRDCSAQQRNVVYLAVPDAHDDEQEWKFLLPYWLIYATRLVIVEPSLTPAGAVAMRGADPLGAGRAPLEAAPAAIAAAFLRNRAAEVRAIDEARRVAAEYFPSVAIEDRVPPAGEPGNPTGGAAGDHAEPDSSTMVDGGAQN